jgi:hypothetical protein
MSGSPGANRPRKPGPNAVPQRPGSRLRSLLDSASRLGTRERLLELITITALLGGCLLILAEFLTLFEISSRGIVVKEQAGGTNHAYAMLVVGVGTIVATLLVRATEQRPPAVGIIVLAAFALAFALLGDLPDATRSDLVQGARIADASPAIGLWTEIAGAIIALGSGVALLALLRQDRAPSASRRSR